MFKRSRQNQRYVQCFFFILILTAALLLAGCSAGSDNKGGGQQGEVQQAAQESDRAGKTPDDPELLLATTTSTYDTGLLDVLKPVFEDKYGYNLKILAKGTGASLELGKRGDVDVLLVHAKDRELKLVEEGYFVDRHDVMYNDFVIIGPPGDPAGIKGMNDAAMAFRKIANSKLTFVSRGDESGTNIKEKQIWQNAGLEPSGSWYLSVGQGVGATLRITNEKKAYALTDRGTYLSMKDKLDLSVLVEGDPVLFNQYGVMAVNPEKHPAVNYEGAQKFIEFMISPGGQEMIGKFTKYGEQLFVPNAEK